MTELLFFIVLALFIVHELDAIQRHEWRLFPYLDRLDDTNGYAVFVLAHLPLLVLVFWLGFAVPAAADPTRIALAAFSIVHIWLHWLFRGHPSNEFGNPLSQAIIWTTGAAGMLYLLAWAFAV